MKKLFSIVLAASLMFFTSFAVVRTASAEEIKMVGTITKIEMATDGKSALVTLKDSKTETSVTITVTDDLTLDKFKDKRIVDGDEIRTKYEKTGEKNNSMMFKKTAGC